MTQRFRRLLVLALLCVASPSLVAQPAKKKLALVGGMLIDGYDVPPVHHAAILLEGNRIVHGGLGAEVACPPDAQVIDPSGRLMMPGLIDVHVHLQILGHGDYDRW